MIPPKIKSHMVWECGSCCHFLKSFADVTRCKLNYKLTKLADVCPEWDWKKNAD